MKDACMTYLATISQAREANSRPSVHRAMMAVNGGDLFDGRGEIMPTLIVVREVSPVMYAHLLPEAKSAHAIRQVGMAGLAILDIPDLNGRRPSDKLVAMAMKASQKSEVDFQGALDKVRAAVEIGLDIDDEALSGIAPGSSRNRILAAVSCGRRTRIGQLGSV